MDNFRVYIISQFLGRPGLTTIMVWPWLIFWRRQQKWNSGQMLSSFAQFTRSKLQLCFVAKNYLRSSLLGSCFASSGLTRPSQGSKYTGGSALCMRICIAVQRLGQNCVQNERDSLCSPTLRTEGTWLLCDRIRWWVHLCAELNLCWHWQCNMLGLALHNEVFMQS